MSSWQSNSARTFPDVEGRMQVNIHWGQAAGRWAISVLRFAGKTSRHTVSGHAASNAAHFDQGNYEITELVKTPDRRDLKFIRSGLDDKRRNSRKNNSSSWQATSLNSSFPKAQRQWISQQKLKKRVNKVCMTFKSGMDDW